MGSDFRHSWVLSAILLLINWVIPGKLLNISVSLERLITVPCEPYVLKNINHSISGNGQQFFRALVHLGC